MIMQNLKYVNNSVFILFDVTLAYTLSNKRLQTTRVLKQTTYVQE
jgi:hypothetical protein